MRRRAPARAEQPAVHSLVEPLDSSTNAMARAQRAAVLLDHRRIELTMWHDLLHETGQPHPSLTDMLDEDEAYQLLTVEAYA